MPTAAVSAWISGEIDRARELLDEGDVGGCVRVLGEAQRVAIAQGYTELGPQIAGLAREASTRADASTRRRAEQIVDRQVPGREPVEPSGPVPSPGQPSRASRSPPRLFGVRPGQGTTRPSVARLAWFLAIAGWIIGLGVAIGFGFALAVWPWGFDDGAGWTDTSIVLAAFYLPLAASLFSAPVWPAYAGIRCLSERPGRSARLFALAGLIALVFLIQVLSGLLFLAAAALAALSARSRSEPSAVPTEPARSPGGVGPGVLYGLAAAFFVVPFAAVVVGESLGLGGLTTIGFGSAYLGVPWLAPGVFVGLARRDVWVGVGVGFASLVAFGVLSLLVIGGEVG